MLLHEEEINHDLQVVQGPVKIYGEPGSGQ